MTNEEVQKLIEESPNACWRTIAAQLDYWNALTDEQQDMLDAARPDCGYDCDGDEEQLDGSRGCPVSKRCEP